MLRVPLVAVLSLAAVFGWGPQETHVNVKPRVNAVRHPRATLRADVQLVLIPVSVSDSFDRPVTALQKENFRVLEDGVEQTISSFTREEAPISLGLLFDSSGSMKNRIGGSVEALEYVLQRAMPGDEFFAVQFADQAQVLVPFTSDSDDILRQLKGIDPKGWTSLLDAVALGSHHMKKAKNRRRILLVLSDGNDNNSRYSEGEIKSLVRESDVQVYAIALYYRPRLLQQLADETGGRVLVAQTMAELSDVVERLSAEIRSQYLVGYTSDHFRNDGKYHKVKIEVVQPPGTPALRTAWKRGYYAPPE